MSKPIRYGLADTDLGRIHPQADGHLVMWADYAALAAENERLRKMFAETERLMLVDGEYEAIKAGTYAQLTAENDRLKADASEGYLLQSFLKWKGMQEEYREWLDWRSGRPSKEGGDR